MKAATLALLSVCFFAAPVRAWDSVCMVDRPTCPVGAGMASLRWLSPPANPKAHSDEHRTLLEWAMKSADISDAFNKNFINTTVSSLCRIFV